MILFKTDIKIQKNLSYTQIIDLYLKKYNIKIRSYFKSHSGTAYLSDREIDIPYLVDDESIIVAFHEIGHILNSNNFENLPPYKFEYWTEIWAIKEAKKWGIKSEKYEKGASLYIKSYVNEVIENGININIIPKYIKKFCKL